MNVYELFIDVREMKRMKFNMWWIYFVVFCLLKTFLEYKTEAQRPTFIDKSVILDNLLNGGCDTRAGFLGSF